MLPPAKKVDYDEDDLWSQWNMAAKIMILTKPRPTTPMGQYYVEHRTTGSEATAFSSLATSSKSATADVKAVDEYPTDKGSPAAQPCPNLHAQACPDINDETTTISKTDSVATLPRFTLEQWEEFNNKKGMGVGPNSWEPKTVPVLVPEMEDEARDKKKEVRQK
jgi:hypothetical protein